jgi:predicted SAM-dependent methyltransferase
MINSEEPFRLHVGGQVPLEGWKILDINPGDHVDYVGDCANLSQFADGTIDEIYLSHVLEHLGHQGEFAAALLEFFRVLKSGGILSVAVPDMHALCEIFVNHNSSLSVKFGVVNILFGGQRNAFDFHRTGFDEALITHFLRAAGFSDLHRVKNFGLLEDASNYQYAGQSVSLNMRARKP